MVDFEMIMGLIPETQRFSPEPGALRQLKDLPKRYGPVEVSLLKHDEPINLANVAIKKASLLKNGQLQPIGVGVSDSEILGIFDGLNRQRAMEELGIQSVDCVLVEMTLEQFRDARIASTAEQHPSLEFARVVGLVRESFAETVFAESIEAYDAFTISGLKSSRVSILNLRQIAELEKWVSDKSKAWGIDRTKIANWLSVADLVTAPELITEVRDVKGQESGFLTTDKLWAIAETVSDPDQQRAFVAKVKAEKLNESAVYDLMDEVRHAPDEQRVRLLQTNWVKIEKEIRLRKQQEKLSRARVFQQEMERRVQEDWSERQIEAVIRGIRFAIHDIPELDLDRNPDLAEKLERIVNDLTIALAKARGGSESPISRLGDEIKKLRLENFELMMRVKQFEKLYSSEKEIHKRDLKSRDDVG